TGITTGPDGALWFTEANSNKIGRITTAGMITNEFPIPTAGSQPSGIVTGPDGNLWFTELSGNNIGRITPAGAVTEFPIPTSASNPTSITLGPDGNLCSTEQGGSRIGERHQSRPGRRAVVHRSRRQQYRADHDHWRGARISDPHQHRRARQHRSRT